MLLRNLDVEAGLCNGVRTIVVHPLEHVLDVKIISGAAAGKRFYIPRLELAPKNPDLPFTPKTISSSARMGNDHKQSTRSNALASRYRFA